jgi:hypothetical protein
MSKARELIDRIFRAIKFDKSLYSDVSVDPEATTQSVLMPFLIWIVIIIVNAIAALPLWFIFGPTITIGGTPLQILAGIGIFILVSIVFVFVPFIIWVLVKFLMGRFVGSKDLQAVQVLRATGFAFSHAFLYAILGVAVIYTAVFGTGLAVAILAPVGGVIILLLIFISNILSFREVAKVTTGVSILANIFAIIIFGLIIAGVFVAVGLAIAGLVGIIFP